VELAEKTKKIRGVVVVLLFLLFCRFVVLRDEWTGWRTVAYFYVDLGLVVGLDDAGGTMRRHTHGCL
jgi:hypothetical protein